MKKFSVGARLALPLFAVLIAALAGCASKAEAAQAARQRAIANLAPIRTIPGPRPAWADETPRDSQVQYFIGVSRRFSTEQEARTSDNGGAQEDARRQLVDYYGTLMVNKGREYSAVAGISSDVFSPQVVGQQLNERIAQNVAQALGNWANYTEVFFNDTTGKEDFVVYSRGEVPKSLVERVINNFGKETAADLQKQAAAEQDRIRRQQLEKAAEFFGGNLSSTLGL